MKNYRTGKNLLLKSACGSTGMGNKKKIIL
jgi:hypothetical protein